MVDDAPGDVESYQEELSAKVDDGGGCAEMWEALSSTRSEGDHLARRTVLRRAAGVIGAGAVGLSALTDTAAAVTDSVDVEEVDGRSRRLLIARAFSDERVRRITRTFVRRGYRPELHEARATTSKLQEDRLTEDARSQLPDDWDPAGEWSAVVVPFETPGEEEQANITWTTSSSVDRQVIGLWSEHVTPVDDSEPFWNVETFTVSGGDVDVETDRMANFLGCANPNTGCIALIAAAYGAEFIACATCGASAGWLIPACGYCLTSVLAAYGTSVTCDWCND